MDSLQIELKDLLNFLSLACKVNCNENSEEIRSADVDLKELASNELIIGLFEYEQTKSTNNQSLEKVIVMPETQQPMKSNPVEFVKNDLDANEAADLSDVEHLIRIMELLKGKLLELLTEGIFDSILTYLTPRKSISSTVNSLVLNEKSIIGPKKKKERKKKNSEVKPILKNETEVEIHVYDEVKGYKRDFKCFQSLLISNMGYFLEITKGQKLEEMDISVHCDISIFEWLMKWIKRDTHGNASDSSPKLDYKNVVPIMVSANFLQMKPLFEDCLYFCKANMNDIIKFSSSLTCLSDHILTKLSEKLSNTEIQQLKDKKDKIKSKLFCKLIMSLNEEEPEKHRGHYSNLAYLYFCSNCGKLVTSVNASYVPCQVQYITVKYNGDIIFNHTRDPKWNINDHIKNIWMEYKSWSSTYWRLWSQCHFLYCYICHTMYAVAFADCCPYHPQQPHFYPLEQFQATNSPIGRYPCCGSKAMRYQTIVMRSGCKLRSHIPKLTTNDDTCIQTIIDLFPDLIKVKCAEHNVASFVEDYDLTNFDGLYKHSFIDKDEQDLNRGLLGGPLFETYTRNIKKNKSVGIWDRKHEANTLKAIERFDNAECSSIGESESSDTSYINDTPIADRLNTAELCNEDVHPQNSKTDMKPIWSSRYSIRHNQDNQRDYEEVAFQAMSDILLQRNEQKKLCSRRTVNAETSYSFGGTYTKIESEWKSRSKSTGNNNSTYK